MPNNFSDSQWVSMEILRLLINRLEVCDYFNREWQRDFDKEFAPGAQVTVKFPQRFKTVDGMGFAPQAINRITTTINLDQWIQVPFEWDDYEVAVKLERSEEELRENYWEPAAAAMAQEWDSRAAQWAYQNSNNVIGSLGTDPTSVQTYYQARQRLEEKAAGPLGKRCMLVSSSMMSSLGAAITSIFQPADEVTKMWKEGVIGKLAKFMFYESQSLFNHTAGTWAAAVTVSGANQSGTSLIITATAGDTFKKGDKFSVVNVNATNPMTYRVAGPKTAQQFTITQDLTAAGGGADTLSILPAIYGPGSQYQNVDSLPANAAALTLWPGTPSPNGKSGTVGLGLTRQAFALTGAKLYLPKAVESRGQAQDPDTGLSVRKVVAWDPVRSMQINRMDSLGGFGNFFTDNGSVCVVGA